MNLKCNAFMYLGGILVCCQATGNIQIIDVHGNKQKTSMKCLSKT